MQTHIHIAHATINVNPGVALDAQFATAALASTEGLTPSPHPTMGETPPAAGEYWQGQGGIYAGILPAIGDQPAQHLVFGTEHPKQLTWGPHGHKMTDANSRINGRANTAAMLADKAITGNAYPAAECAAAYSADGHSDFHLPSQAELFMASLHAPKAFSQAGWYWSSTQNSCSYAFGQDFEGGSSDWSYKDITCRVRPVRWIPL